MNWFEIKAKSNVPEIYILDAISSDRGIGAKNFINQLHSLGNVGEIDLYINSPGGSVFEGAAIYNALKNHKAKINVHVYGLAASIASLIAMSGDVVTMPANTMLMIHNPAGGALGESKDMRSMADTLDKIRQSMVTSYTTKSGLSENKVIQMMDDETWLTAQEAYELGFADKITPEQKIAASFDLSGFSNIPHSISNNSNYNEHDEWRNNPELRSEFGDDQDRYLAFKKANDAGRVKILGGRTNV